MSDVTAARPFRRKEPQAPMTFTITVEDLQRDWTLSLEARERIVTEVAAQREWSGDELRTHIESLRLGERERLFEDREPNQ